MAQPLKILLVDPSRYVAPGKLLKPRSLLFPSLTLPVLAALTPDDVAVTIQTECFEDIDFDSPVDLVGITAYTSRAYRAYEIADEFRRRNVPVVMGGIHVSMVPDEAQEHADTVIVGEAEETWPQFIEDFRNDRAKARYVAERFPPLEGLPAPDFSLLDMSRYLASRTRGIYRLLPLPLLPVQTARGCPHDCEFCAVTAYNGRRVRHRPIADVINEIKTLGPRTCFFVDDNIFAVPARAKELFKALIPLRIRWAGQGTIGAAEDPELLRLARDSGCTIVCVGLESLSAASLAAMKKTHNTAADYERLLKVYRTMGVSVIASMIFGYVADTPDVFDTTCEFLIRNRLPYTIWWTAQPFPGTRFLERLRKEGRLKEERWWLNLEASAEFLSLQFNGIGMDEEVYYKRFMRTYARFYSLPNIARRMLMPPQRRFVQKGLFNFLLRKRMKRASNLIEN